VAKTCLAFAFRIFYAPDCIRKRRVVVALPCSGVIIADAGRITESEHEAGGVPDILEVFGARFDEIIVVSCDPAAWLAFDALIVTDHYVPRGIWSGIHAGLFAARHAHAFITACGMPMTTADLIELFRGEIAPRYDAILPEGDHVPLPLPGIYGKSCLKPLARQLAHGDSAGHGWLRQIRVHALAQDMLRRSGAQTL
jgi:molybdenum cofactor guanylyltransferase